MEIIAPPLVQAEGIVMRFPGVVALSSVDLGLYPGEVHALVGENGAGKSSLIKVLSGFYTPDSGTLRVDGRPMVHSVSGAKSVGIATIHQEHQLIPSLSIAENVVMPRWSTNGGFVRRASLNKRAQSVLQPLVGTIDVTRSARTLSPGTGQLVEVARGLAQDARVLILDEPTTALSQGERDKLFAVVRQLRANGLTILYVSHNLDDVMSLADRVTVLRNGKNVASGVVTDFTIKRIVQLMVGRELRVTSILNTNLGEPVLSVEKINRGKRVRNVSFEVRAGEVFALVGLEGSGRTEVARCIFGMDRMDSGTVTVNGSRIKLTNTASAIAAGIGLVPEERKTQGIFPTLSVRENISVSMLQVISRLGMIRSRTDRELAQNSVHELDIRTPTIETAIGTLSGGNQQKVILARWVNRGCKVLILDEPTKGIDVGAKTEIYQLIKKLAETGTAVILISSDLDECLPIANRFGVMRQGALVRTLDRESATKEVIISAASGDLEGSKK